jgi:hypothetical protein
MTLTKTSATVVLLLLAITVLMAVAYNSHALKHVEAPSIRQSLCDKPPQEVWKRGTTFYLLCVVDKNKWAISARTKDNCGIWQEITAFIKGLGSHTESVQYLERCGASRIKKNIPVDLR